MAFPQLIDMSDGTEKNNLDITSTKFSIGRGLQNSFVVENIAISRNHCAIEYLEGAWTILDTSANGTLLNDNILSRHKRAKLEDGDIISLSESLKYKFKLNSVTLDEDDELANIADAVLATVDCLLDNTVKSQNSQASPMERKVVNLSEQNAACVSPAIESASDIAKNTNSNSQVPNAEKNLEIEEEELTCSICTELFIKAVTLKCSHTFCKYCINQWCNTKSICPICRTRITGENPTLIINNFVEKFLLTASEEVKNHRKEIMEQRDTEKTKRQKLSIASSSTSVTGDEQNSNSTIEISSDDIDDEEDDEYYLDDDDDYYNGSTGAYYGGYGSCYCCGERGHWANTCPNNPRTRRRN